MPRSRNATDIMITVIDYGMGNSGSILNMFVRIGTQAILSGKPAEIATADKLVLPGVGAFDKGMNQLHRLGLVDLLTDKVIVKQTPILGICLGMQLFAESSEEGERRGLGWIGGRAVRFRFDAAEKELPIPHMGWNTLAARQDHPVLVDLGDSSRFYFVHSYHVQCTDPDHVLAETRYGTTFVSAVAKGSIVGVQFHPEKSLRWGMQLFRRFVKNAGVPTTTSDSVLAIAE